MAHYSRMKAQCLSNHSHKRPKSNNILLMFLPASLLPTQVLIKLWDRSCGKLWSDQQARLTSFLFFFPSQEYLLLVQHRRSEWRICCFPPRHDHSLCFLFSLCCYIVLLRVAVSEYFLSRLVCGVSFSDKDLCSPRRVQVGCKNYINLGTRICILEHLGMIVQYLIVSIRLWI